MQFDHPVPGGYIPRAVDGDCLRALRAGRNFHVFAPPQTGKTRLRQRIADTLRASGLRVVELDLARRGGELFFDLALGCAAAIGLGDPAAFWDRFADLEPAERWQRFLQTGPTGGPIVLLIDSVEALLSDGRDVEAFFSALRPARVIGRTPIVSCLFGTLQPVDLGVDIRTASLGRSAVRAWFRTAVQLRPMGFDADELQCVLPRLEAPGADAEALRNAVLEWTAGHPALTTTLIEAIADGGPLMISGSEADTVAATVDALFFEADRSTIEAFAAAEAWTDCGDPAATARCWARIRNGEAVGWRPGDEAHRLLCMAGLAWIDGAVLRPSSRIFTEVFDEAWCDTRTLAETLGARALAWREHGEDDGHLLAGDLLRRASAWAEGREVDPTIAELIVASWVHVRHSEGPGPVAAPTGQLVHSMPPAALPPTAPPARIAAAGTESVAVCRPRDRAPAASAGVVQSAAPRVGAVGRWLAVAVVAMALVTAGLLVALTQSRGGVRHAISALTGQPPTASAGTGASQPGAASAGAPDRVADLEAAIARTEARLDVLEAAATDEPRTAAARPTPSDAAETTRLVEDEQQALAARTKREAAARHAVQQRRAAEERAAEQRAERKRAAEERAAEQRTEQRRAERRAARRRAERRAAAKRAAQRRADRQAAEARAARRRAEAEAAAARPGPVAAPAPAVAITRQAPSYRRALVRCKHYDLPQRVQLRLTVQPDGRVARVAVTRGAADRIDHSCLVDSAQRFRFAPFGGSAVTAAVDYRL